jgi:HEAT repeat protein
VRAFQVQVNGPPLAELARAPLLATILCQLHTARPDRALPRDYYSIYQNFLQLLRQRLHDPQVPDLPDAILTALRNVAAQEHHGRRVDWPDANLLTAVLRATERLCPPGLLALDWESRCNHLLRQTGLVTNRGYDYVFVHETISEFLAAQHVANDACLSRHAFRQLFGWRGIRGETFSSYHRFLIAAWHVDPPPPGLPPRLTKTLHRMAARRNDVWLIAGLAAADGIALASQTIDAAISTLTRQATRRTEDGERRVRAAEMLNYLGDPQGSHRLLAALAADFTVWDLPRVEVAQLLDDLGDPLGRRTLAALAGAASWNSCERLLAADTLTRMGDLRGPELLVELAVGRTMVDDLTLDHDRTLAGFIRGSAVETLTALDDPRATERWIALATDPVLNLRLRATGVVARLDDPRGPGAVSALAALATNPTVKGLLRVRAAGILARLGDPRAAEAWTTLATSSTVNDDLCVKATRIPARLSDLGRHDLLAALAADPTLNDDLRVHAARALSKMGDPRGHDLLAALAGDPTLYGRSRVCAAEMLEARSDPRGRDLLIALVADANVRGTFRLWAAWWLEEAADPRATELWTALVTDPTLPGYNRVEAAYALGDRRGWTLRRSRIVASIVQFTTRVPTTVLFRK